MTGDWLCWQAPFAAFASAVAISLFHRARASHGRTRAIWICLDAAVGGCGIWATHFVAMLAYDPGAGAGYSIPVTLLSLLFAICIVAIGLCVALSSARQSVVAIGGAIIGGGVAAMHYTGMAALELPAYIVWAPGIVLASIVFGSVFAAIAMLVAVRRDDSVHTLAAAGLLTVAIVSHHFTAMGAVTLVPDPTLGSDASNGFAGRAFVSDLDWRPLPFSAYRCWRPCSIAPQRANSMNKRSCSIPRSTTCRRDFACSMRKAASCCSTSATSNSWTGLACRCRAAC